MRRGEGKCGKGGWARGAAVTAGSRNLLEERDFTKFAEEDVFEKTSTSLE